MKLNPNLVFNGIAEPALEHYRDALGGDIEIMRFADSPAAGSVEPDWADKVIYGTLRSPAGNLNAMDALVACCRRYGVAPGFLPATPESAAHWIRKGFRAISLGSDIGVFLNGMRTFRQAVIDCGGRI